MASVTARRLVRTNVFLRCLALPLTELKFARTWTNVFHRFGHPHANRASWGNGNQSWNKLRVQEMLCRAAQETSGQRYIFITLTMTHSPFSVSVPGFSYIQPPASVLATTSTLLSQQRGENLENSEWVLCKAKYTWLIKRGRMQSINRERLGTMEFWENSIDKLAAQFHILILKIFSFLRRFWGRFGYIFINIISMVTENRRKFSHFLEKR